jgi:tetratricopeptide (TPR) repeat protein
VVLPVKRALNWQYFTVISGISACAFVFGPATTIRAFSAPQKTEFLKSEEDLLKAVAVAENRFGPGSCETEQRLGELASFYMKNLRYDENGMIRERMTKLFVTNNPNWRPPLPGGPYLRIGYPGDKSESLQPKSILSHWLNRKSLPKFYAKDQITFEDYKKDYELRVAAAEKSGKAIDIANSLLALGNLYCAEACFSSALPLYEKSLKVRDGANAHGLQAYRDLLENLDALALVYRIEGRNDDASKIEQRADERRSPDW